MQKGFAQLLLLLAVLLLLLGGGAYFFRTQKGKTLLIPKLTVQKSPVSEFNNYTNKDLGFGFKYSKSLSVKNDTEEEFNQRSAGAASKSVNGDYRKNFKGYVGYEPPKIVGAVAVLEKDEKFEANPFSVWVFSNEDALEAEQWFENYWYYPFVWGVFDYVSKGHIALDREATVSGQSAKYKVVDYQQGKPKFVYVSKDEKMYLFRIIGNAGEMIFSSLALE